MALVEGQDGKAVMAPGEHGDGGVGEANPEILELLHDFQGLPQSVAVNGSRR